MPTEGKRKRQSDHSPHKMNGLDEKHELFTQWAKGHSVEINGVKPAKLPGRGLGLVTTQKIKMDQRLLFVPEKAMFKPDTKFLKKNGLQDASPQAQLAVSAAAAFLNNEDLAVWKRTWPTRDDFQACMPSYWPKSTHDLLPPSVHLPLDRLLADFEKDQAAAAEYAKAHFPESEDWFKYVWTIVNSRSFYWKPPRGRAGCMVMCPFIDYMNHGPSGETAKVVQAAGGYEVLADRDYDAGEEVLATYGSHSNDKLLVHYGFVCSHEPDGHSVDDDIRLDHIVLPKIPENIRTQLQDVGFLGGYALLPASNELCFKTQVAVRAVLQTCNEWEHFLSSGEDLTVDHTQMVDDWVKALLPAYRKMAEEKIAAAEKLENETAMSILTLRWRQIIDAIDRFTST